MTTYCLSPFTIRILDPGGNYLPVHDFLGGNDLCSVLLDFLTGLKKDMYQNSREEFVLRLQSLEVKGRFLSGLMERGEYGITSKFFNTSLHNFTYTRDKADAELLPYFFLLGVPKPTRRLGGREPLDAIAIFQTTDGEGVQDDFEESFTLYFDDRFPPLHLDIRRLIPRQFSEQLLRKGRVTQLRFVKYGVRKNLEDAAQLGPVESEGVLEFRVKAKRGKAFDLTDRLEEVLSGRRSTRDLLEVKGFHYDDVKIQLESEGRYHTLNLGRLNSTRAPYEYDITSKLESPGHNPDYEKIHRLARQFCQNLADDMELSF